MSRLRKRLLSGVAAVVALVGLLAACGDGGALAALESDSLATRSFDHLEETDVMKQKAGEKLGKPVSAQVARTFTVTGGDREAVIEAIGEDAVDDGWTRDESADGSFAAHKTIDGHEATVLVATQGTDEVLLVLSAAK